MLKDVFGLENAMLSLIGKEGTDAGVHVGAIYCEHIRKHTVIREP